MTEGRAVTSTKTGPSRFQRLSGYAVVLLALALVGGLYTAFAAPKSNAADSTSSEQSMAVKAGRELFLQGCSTCHGLNLQGGAGGPSLIGVGESAVIFQVESGRMPLYAGTVQAPRKKAKYSIAEIDQLAAYVGSIGGGPSLPKGALNDGQLQMGGDLFRTNCASCHNFAGAGGALTYGKYAPPLSPSSARVIYTAMQTGPESMPRFTDNQLTPDEKKAITKYVEFITKAPQPGGNDLGRYGPVPEGLVIWLVGIGALVGLTLWIGARA
ncbi:MAG: qcrC [Frankiales bacterium]|jgi:ubiquinol-cytochrome c reductase cytochrome c subunit|nr:qcrC [Frankiales bacterium]